MSVYQIEQYYISISEVVINDEDKRKIEEYLTRESLSDYEFQDGGVVIDGFESETEAQEIEDGIMRILHNHKRKG